MKNITLAIDDGVLAKVRLRAAQDGTTVNAMVRDYLTRLAGEDERIAQARKELLELARTSTLDMGPGWKWIREDVYDRPGPSGHQRADLRGVAEDPPADKGADRK
jgi:plasmid stability protein